MIGGASIRSGTVDIGVDLTELKPRDIRLFPGNWWIILHLSRTPLRVNRGVGATGLVALVPVLGQGALVVARVHDPRDRQLFEVADALGALGLLLGFGQSGQKEGGENGDDGDDHQQLDQGETMARPGEGGALAKSWGLNHAQ